jgi:hypothetical protein
MYTNILRGADPELFLRDVHGNPITSIGLIGGSKTKPRKLGNGFALQEDNVAVEFNIPPCSNKEQFVASLNYVLEHLRQELGSKGLSLDISATAEFTEEQLKHPQAQELGCEPDYNAWTLDMNPRPTPPANLRSSGGHLHIGWDNPEPIEQIRVIKVHDLFVGVPSLIYDEDSRRREIYGKAGAYRPKEYGVEYRTLSNFWIGSNELMEFVYSQSEKAMNFLINGGFIPEEDGEKIQMCINNGDKNLLSELNEKYSIV